MEFTNEFSIPLGIDEAFEVLTDLERVAPCMPGATLEEVDGRTYGGRVKVKVGPMSLTYAGTATLTDTDPQAHTARIEASGREKRGAGTASADVRAELQERGGQTVVTVVTDINVTGKPAQFGRGVMADVGAKIIDRFAENLQEMLEAAPEPADETPTPATRQVPRQAPRDDALDLMDLAGPAAVRRLVPLGVGLVLLVLVLRRRRRRRA